MAMQAGIFGDFLALDLGGTTVEAALARVNSGQLVALKTIRVATGDHADFAGVMTAVTRELGIANGHGATHPGPQIQGAAVAVAGPVVNGRAQLTNVPWAVEESFLQTLFPAARVRLMNDMEAHGFAAVALMTKRRGVALPEGLLVESSPLLDGPVDPHGSACVIAPGTGLGEGFIVWTGTAHRPLGCEGGHASFSPINDEQMQLLNFLRHTQGHHHVSWERLVSGKFGLPNLFLFVTRELGIATRAEGLEADVMNGNHPVQALMTAAENGDPAADKVLELFVGLLGQEAGNLALKIFATGGVFVSGGLAQRMKVLLKGKYLEAFREGMCAKGRFRPLLSRLPVIFLEDRMTALKGAMVSLFL